MPLVSWAKKTFLVKLLYLGSKNSALCFSAIFSPGCKSGIFPWKHYKALHMVAYPIILCLPWKLSQWVTDFLLLIFSCSLRTKPRVTAISDIPLKEVKFEIRSIWIPVHDPPNKHFMNLLTSTNPPVQLLPSFLHVLVYE